MPPHSKRARNKKKEYDDLDYSTEICGAFTRAGGRCRQIPVKGRTRCHYHGGKSPRGHASPHWRGKGYSKSAPVRYADLMSVLDDGRDLGSLIDEIRVHVARHHELLSRLTTGEFGEGWRRLEKLLEKAGRSLDSDRPDDVSHYLDAAVAATDDALADEKTWKAITTNALTLAKLSDTERKRDEFLARQISAEQWARLLGALARMIARHVTDEDTRRAIAHDLRPFLSVTRAAEPEVELKLMELTQSRGGNGSSGHRSPPAPGQRAHAETPRPRDLSVAEPSEGSAREEV